MGRTNYIKKKKANPIAIIGREKSLLKKHYTILDCQIKNGTLFCYGSFKPSEHSITYSYRIKYKPNNSPRVYVTTPVIEFNDDIHMFPKDNSLCLYHKSDLVWNENHHLFDTIVPWTHEWFVFYEIYQITGKWEHPFIPHKSTKEEN